MNPSPRIAADNSTSDKTVRDAIFATLLIRGLSTRELASAIGRALTTTVEVINGGSPCIRTRRKIENYLRHPFWTSPDDFKERLHVMDFFGADVEALPLGELIELCRKHQLLGRRSTGYPRGYFLDLLMIHYAAANSDALPSSPPNENIQS